MATIEETITMEPGILDQIQFAVYGELSHCTFRTLAIICSKQAFHAVLDELGVRTEANSPGFIPEWKTPFGIGPSVILNLPSCGSALVVQVDQDSGFDVSVFRKRNGWSKNPFFTIPAAAT